ncbi:MAG: nitroreductase family protein [Lishizhenia sp.]
MDIVKALEWRYAVKKFDKNEKLAQQSVERIAKALSLTATSMGMQLLEFIIIKDEAIKNSLLDACYNQNQVSTCSHLIVLARKNKVDQSFLDAYIDRISEVKKIDKTSAQLTNFANMIGGTLKMEEQKQIKWMENQVYIALGNLLTVCAAEKIDACPMEGFRPEKVDELLNLHEKGLNSVLLCPIGIRAKDDKYAEMPKVRRPLNETIHYI